MIIRLEEDVEREMIATYKNPASAIHSIHALLSRVRELEKREAELVAELEKIAALTNSRTGAPGAPGAP